MKYTHDTIHVFLFPRRKLFYDFQLKVKFDKRHERQFI